MTTRILPLAIFILLGTSLPAAPSKAEGTGNSIGDYYAYWKAKYLIPSSGCAGDFKVDYNGKGVTVSEAMGYGMLITAAMGRTDPGSKACFDGLNHFRKRFPSKLNHAFMCWKVPSNERAATDDCATDGEMDIAFALLLANRQWHDPSYLKEAKALISNIGTTLVRDDFSLRLGDWNVKEGQTRPSDIMPTHFRAFGSATGDPLWKQVEERCYVILEELQCGAAPDTGLVPDFALKKGEHWVPAGPRFLEGRDDGDYYYNACRVPWRIGWAAISLDDERAKRIVARLIDWAEVSVKHPVDFRAGYRLDGRPVWNSDFQTACFISPTGVAAMATGRKEWRDETLSFAAGSREQYYEDSVNLLCLLVMSGKLSEPF